MMIVMTVCGWWRAGWWEFNGSNFIQSDKRGEHCSSTAAQPKRMCVCACVRLYVCCALQPNRPIVVAYASCNANTSGLLSVTGLTHISCVRACESVCVWIFGSARSRMQCVIVDWAA